VVVGIAANAARRSERSLVERMHKRRVLESARILVFPIGALPVRRHQRLEM
jgi:hypothetical protein